MYDGPKKRTGKCTYLNSPTIKNLAEKIYEISMEKNPTLLVFDEIGCLLKYNTPCQVVSFVNTIASSTHYSSREKVFLLEKEENNLEKKTLLKDILLFADEAKEIKEDI